MCKEADDPTQNDYPINESMIIAQRIMRNATEEELAWVQAHPLSDAEREELQTLIEFDLL